MGALYAGICYESASSAARVHFSGVAPSVSSGSPSYLSSVQEVLPDSWAMVVRESGLVVESIPLDYPSFPLCDPGQALLDGMQIGWLVVACWAAAWAIVTLKRSWS